MPLPVPPEISMLTSALDRPASTSPISGVRLWLAMRLSICSGTAAKRRIDITGPSSASGGMITFTREPSGRRASAIGLDSSTRRPTRETILSMIFIRWLSSTKLTFVVSSRPRRSTYTCCAAVDQDVGDARVGQQRLQGAQAQHLVLDVAHQVAPLGAVDDHVLFGQQPLDHRAQFLAQPGVGQALHRLQVEAGQQELVHLHLHLLVGARGARRRLASRGDRLVEVAVVVRRSRRRFMVSRR